MTGCSAPRGEARHSTARAGNRGFKALCPAAVQESSLRMAIADSTFHTPKTGAGQKVISQNTNATISFQAYSRHGAHPQGMAHTAFLLSGSPAPTGPPAMSGQAPTAPIFESLAPSTANVWSMCSAVHSRLPAMTGQAIQPSHGTPRRSYERDLRRVLHPHHGRACAHAWQAHDKTYPLSARLQYSRACLRRPGRGGHHLHAASDHGTGAELRGQSAVGVHAGVLLVHRPECELREAA